MLSIEHRFNGVKVNPPINQDDISIGFVNHVDRVERVDTKRQFTWTDNEFKAIRGKLDDLSLFESLEHAIVYRDNPDSRTFQRYIDISGASFDDVNSRVEADSVVDRDLDWLTEYAAGISFERLFDEGAFTVDDFIQIPYILSSVPDYGNTLLTILSLVVVKIEIENAANELKAILAEIAVVFSSVGAFLRALVRLIRFALLILTLVELILDVFAYLIQQVKYTPAMGINQLLRIGLADAGFTLDSPIPEDEVIIPKQFQHPDGLGDSRIKGIFFPEDSDLTGYYRGRLDELFRVVNDTYFLKLEIKGNVVKLVPFNQEPTAASVKLPPVDQRNFTINARDLANSLNLSFAYDLQDDNTVTNWQGTNVKVIFRPASGKKPTLNPLGRFGINREFEFALANAKEKLTPIEQIFDILIDAVDGVINLLITAVNALIKVINTITRFIKKILNPIIRFFGGRKIKLSTDIPTIKKVNFGDLIEDRIGMLAIEQDSFSVDKIAKIQFSTTPRNTKIISKGITAKRQFEEYWKNVNQQIFEYELQNIELKLEQVLTIEEELAVEFLGRKCRVKEFNWNGSLTGGKADMRVELFKDFVSLTQEIREPDAA